ncbi:hypothetical protein ACHAXT_007879 [Thalassiosira profunda]
MNAAAGYDAAANSIVDSSALDPSPRSHPPAGAGDCRQHAKERVKTSPLRAAFVDGGGEVHRLRPTN